LRQTNAKTWQTQEMLLFCVHITQIELADARKVIYQRLYMGRATGADRAVKPCGCEERNGKKIKQ
jgi:hypothetical protein